MLKKYAVHFGSKFSLFALFVAAFTINVQAGYPNEGIYSDSYINIWTGNDSTTPTYWNAPANWSMNAVPVGGTDQYVHVDGYDDISGKTGFRGAYAKFENNASLIVTASDEDSAFETRGVIVAAGSGQLTIQKAENWEDSDKGLLLSKNNNRPSFFNYSSNHVIFDISVKFGGIGYGATGVLPGAEFNRVLTYNIGGDQFKFYAGDPERSDAENTTVIRARANFSYHNAEIQQDHIVKLEGVSSSMTAADVTVAGRLEVDGGTLTCGSLSTSGNGVVKLNNATFVPGSDVSGLNIEISGILTINNGEYNVDLSSATFVDGSVLEHTGTGAITLPSSGTLPFVVANYSVEMQKPSNVSASTWIGSNGGTWDTASNWDDNAVPMWDAWRITQFNLGDAMSTKLGENNQVAAWGLVVDANSKQLTIDETPDGYNTLRFYSQGKDTPYTSFINYSANPVIFNVQVSISGYRYGSSGVLPGAIYRGNCKTLGVDGLSVRLTASGQAVNAKFFDFRVGRPMRGRAFAGDSAVLAVA